LDTLGTAAKSKLESRFVRAQARFSAVALQPPGFALGQLVFKQSLQQPVAGPAFGV